MATTLYVSCTVNEEGDAQDPAADVEAMLKAPDDTVHTAWGAMSSDSDAGTGGFTRAFTIEDSDPAGVYRAFFRTTTDGGKTPLNVAHISVK